MESSGLRKVSGMVYARYVHAYISYEPAHEIMVLTTYATSECSGETARMPRCSHTWSMAVDEGSDQKSDN